MKKLLLSTIIASAAMFAATEAKAAPTFFDDFNTGNQFIELDSDTTVNDAVGASVPGGTRDITVTANGASAIRLGTVAIDPPVDPFLIVGNDTGVESTTVVDYPGIENYDGTPTPLSAGFGFEIVNFNPGEAPLQFTVTLNGISVTKMFNTPIEIGVDDPFVLQFPFADFVGLDPNDLDSVSFTLLTSPETDLIVDALEIYEAIPAPALLPATLAALGGLAKAKSMKKQQA